VLTQRAVPETLRRAWLERNTFCRSLQTRANCLVLSLGPSGLRLCCNSFELLRRFSAGINRLRRVRPTRAWRELYAPPRRFQSAFNFANQTRMVATVRWYILQRSRAGFLNCDCTYTLAKGVMSDVCAIQRGLNDNHERRDLCGYRV
jgi:hypothetical protein